MTNQIEPHQCPFFNQPFCLFSFNSFLLHPHENPSTFIGWVKILMITLFSSPKQPFYTIIQMTVSLVKILIFSLSSSDLSKLSTEPTKPGHLFINKAFQKPRFSRKQQKSWSLRRRSINDVPYQGRQGVQDSLKKGMLQSRKRQVGRSKMTKKRGKSLMDVPQCNVLY